MNEILRLRLERSKQINTIAVKLNIKNVCALVALSNITNLELSLKDWRDLLTIADANGGFFPDRITNILQLNIGEFSLLKRTDYNIFNRLMGNNTKPLSLQSILIWQNPTQSHFFIPSPASVGHFINVIPNDNNFIVVDSRLPETYMSMQDYEIVKHAWNRSDTGLIPYVALLRSK